MYLVAYLNLHINYNQKKISFQNKTLVLTKSMKMAIWVIRTLNQLSVFTLKLNFQKKKKKHSN